MHTYVFTCIAHMYVVKQLHCGTTLTPTDRPGPHWGNPHMESQANLVTGHIVGAIYLGTDCIATATCIHTHTWTRVQTREHMYRHMHTHTHFYICTIAHVYPHIFYSNTEVLPLLLLAGQARTEAIRARNPRLSWLPATSWGQYTSALTA